MEVSDYELTGWKVEVRLSSGQGTGVYVYPSTINDYVLSRCSGCSVEGEVAEAIKGLGEFLRFDIKNVLPMPIEQVVEFFKEPFENVPLYVGDPKYKQLVQFRLAQNK